MRSGGVETYRMGDETPFMLWEQFGRLAILYNRANAIKNISWTLTRGNCRGARSDFAEKEGADFQFGACERMEAWVKLAP